MIGSSPMCRCGHPRDLHYRDGSEQGGGCDGAAIGDAPVRCRCKGFTEAPAVSVPQSEHGGIHPELAARITSASASAADFDRETDEYANSDDSPTPDWQGWSFRLWAELRNIIKLLEDS